MNSEKFMLNLNPPKNPVEHYQHIISSQAQANITLNAEQQAMIYALDDYGLQAVNDENIHVLYGIIADLKNSIRS